MENSNKRKRDEHDSPEVTATSVGAFTGDTMASALDPFGSAAVGSSDGTSDNKAGKGTVDDDDKMAAPKREL
ncbi:hypothetical protein M3193_14855 [Sporosarcina luteola]|uniref:hypothetical protein n=1 Tax=Sporosarcina luteola TaxID=582850 RepID=UPI00203F8A2C|nr:hypothetical protein [Sporosarcina luteola]MCM3745404.1 hypothetical protein [Sporosarcina luteola]